jgi:hypothetical protein
MSGLNGVKVGDRLLVRGELGSRNWIEVVAWVTETLVVTDRGRKFRLRDGRIPGTASYIRTQAAIATAEDIERVEIETLRREIAEMFEPRMQFVISLPLLRQIRDLLSAEVRR